MVTRQSLTEMVYPIKEIGEMARGLFEQIPEIEFLGYETEILKHPWVTNRRGSTTVLDIHIDPDSPEVVNLVKETLVREGVEGAYLFLWQVIWVKIQLAADYAWVERLWELSKGCLTFLSVDETHLLDIFLGEWDLEVEVKRRDKTVSLPDFIDPLSSEVTATNRLDTDYAISGNLDGDALLWRVADRRVERVFQGYSEHANAVKIKGNLVLSKAQWANLTLWDISTGEIIRETKRYREVGAIGRFLVIDENHVLTALHQHPTGGIALWDVTTGEITKLFGLGHSADDLLQVDEDHVVAAVFANSLHLWHIRKEELVRSFEGHEGPVRAVIRKDQDTLLSCSYDKTIRSWDIATGKSHLLLELDHLVHGLIEKDGYLLTISGELPPIEYRLELWHLQTLKRQASVMISAPSYIPERLKPFDETTIIIQYYDAVQLAQIITDERGRPHLSVMGRLRPV